MSHYCVNTDVRPLVRIPSVNLHGMTALFVIVVLITEALTLQSRDGCCE